MPGEPHRETGPSEFRRVTEVNYLGTVNGTLAALRRMRPRDRGVIVQVGSALSYRAIPLQATYCASKFAVRGFTDSVRTELRHDGSGVRVSASGGAPLAGLAGCRKNQARHDGPDFSRGGFGWGFARV